MYSILLMVILHCLTASSAIKELDITESFFLKNDFDLKENDFCLTINQSYLTDMKHIKFKIKLPEKVRYVVINMKSSLEVIPNRKLSCGVLRIGVVKWTEVDGAPFFKKGFMEYSFAMIDKESTEKGLNVHSNDTFMIYYHSGYTCERNISECLTFQATTFYVSSDVDKEMKYIRKSSYTFILSICLAIIIIIICIVILCRSKLVSMKLRINRKWNEPTDAEVEQVALNWKLPTKIKSDESSPENLCVKTSQDETGFSEQTATPEFNKDKESVFVTNTENVKYSLESQQRIGRTAPNFENWGPVEGLSYSGEWIFKQCDCEDDKWSDIINKRDIGMRSRLLLLPESFSGLTIVVELKGMSRNNLRDQFRIRFSAVSGIKENEEINLPVRLSVRVEMKLDGQYRSSNKHELEITELWGYAEPDDFFMSFRGTKTKELPRITFQFFSIG